MTLLSGKGKFAKTGRCREGHKHAAGSSIFIYAALPEHGFLRQWFTTQGICASNITRLEVLGYHRLNEADKHDLNRLFECVTIYPVSSSIIDFAIHLRQQRKMSLGDAVIAATALEYRQTLVTRNTDDFDWLAGRIESDRPLQVRPKLACISSHRKDKRLMFC